MSNAGCHAGKLLVIHYRATETQPVPVGVVLYVPTLESLYVRFRADFGNIDQDALEVLSGTSEMFASMATDHGAEATYNWIASSLSNTVFVEDPLDVSTFLPEQTVYEMYSKYCD